MLSNQINELLEKYLNGTISDIEKQELFNLYKQIGHQEGEYPDERIIVKDRILAGLNKEVQAKKSPVRLWSWISAAAVLFVVAFLSYNYLVRTPGIIPQEIASNEPIIPGGNYAYLTLDNGEILNLNKLDTGKIAVQGGMDIFKVSAEKVIYKSNGKTSRSISTLNTISTPAGGQFQVRLSDGTDVWLNAKSTLKFASSFSRASRIVQLVGEGYFEVFKNKKSPFHVLTRKTNVEVLGTHFNVLAYDDEKTKTTLLEGAIALSGRKSKVVLRPGQQGIVEKDVKEIFVDQVNVQDAVSWKNGYFSFRGDNLKEAMNKIARWYNVEIIYNGNPEAKSLGGSVSRTENIRKLLDYMELTGVANFKIQERRIIVNCK